MENTQTSEKRQFRKPSMRDVSKRAQVSLATVSNYLSGRPGTCNAETASRIDAALAEFHYTHNSLVRGIRLGKTNCIGGCVTNPTDFSHGPQPSFTVRMWQGMEAVANEHQLLLLQYPIAIRNGHDIRPFLDGRIDGLIMSTSANDPRPAEIVAAGMPAVFVNIGDAVPANSGFVRSNEDDTAGVALSHLWERGHRRIAHLCAHPADGSGQISGIAMDRSIGYRRWMTKAGAFTPSYLVSATNWDEAGVEDAIERLFSLPAAPTALFCANDVIAAKAIATLQARGLEVPRDVSVVGVDGGSTNSGPKVTSVDVPVELMGVTAMRALIRLMDGAPIEECRTAIPVSRLVAGETVQSIAES